MFPHDDGQREVVNQAVVNVGRFLFAPGGVRVHLDGTQDPQQNWVANLATEDMLGNLMSTRPAARSIVWSVENQVERSQTAQVLERVRAPSVQHMGVST